jgi:NADPH:quinone reductase-like Zn-dependent oxidoreductase/2-polyprenyl-3-methyl-5-hydroxy-6-metoxy-1,4-benzoquinol methylase/NADP-dependent 3-hydroxy acid dehydrogenase YdfG
MLSMSTSIVSISIKLPSINNLEEYWDILSNGKSVISEIKECEQFYTTKSNIVGKNISYGRGYALNTNNIISEVYKNINIATKNIKLLNTGVFIGADFKIAQDISKTFKYTGMSINIDTACSSGLAALDVAVKAINNNDIDSAIVGCINKLSDPDMSIIFSKLGVLSPNNKCSSFDTSADGYVRSEGIVILVIKKTRDAIVDNDYIFAEIDNIMSNCSSNRSDALTSPSTEAQESMLRKLISNSNIGIDNTDNIKYVEAHGTGTHLGDIIEANAIGNILHSKRKLYIGSVKPNIGHTEIASGLASIVKVLLMFKHNKIPPNINFKTPSENIKFTEYNMVVPIKLISLDSDYIIVNNFGFGGANSAVLLHKCNNKMNYEMNNILPNNISDKIITTTTNFALKQRINTANIEYYGELCLDHFEWIKDHCIQNALVVPGVFFINIFDTVAKTLFHDYILKDIKFVDALWINKNTVYEINTTICKINDDVYELSISSRDMSELSNIYKLNTKCIVLKDDNISLNNIHNMVEILPCCIELSVDDFYNNLLQDGMQYGPLFKQIKKIYKYNDEYFGIIPINNLLTSAELSKYSIVHPSILDCAIQVGLYTREKPGAFLPIGIDSVKVYKHESLIPTTDIIVHVCNKNIYVWHNNSLILEFNNITLKYLNSDIQLLREQWVEDNENCNINTSEFDCPIDINKAFNSEFDLIDKNIFKNDELLLLKLDKLIIYMSKQLKIEKNNLIPEQYYKLLKEWSANNNDKQPNNYIANTIREIYNLSNRYYSLAFLVYYLYNDLNNILSGNLSVSDVLFNNTICSKLLEQWYRDFFIEYFHMPVCSLLLKICSELRYNQYINILEIGAGTGGFTRWLLSILPANKIKYTFTDIGAQFVSNAKHTLSKEFPNVNINYKVLNLEKNIVQQGINTKYDIVIGFSVVHAVENINKTLSYISEVLNKNALIIFGEPTMHLKPFDFIFGLTDGWWKHNDGRDNACVSTDIWHTMLSSSGYTDILFSNICKYFTTICARHESTDISMNIHTNINANINMISQNEYILEKDNIFISCTEATLYNKILEIKPTKLIMNMPLSFDIVNYLPIVKFLYSYIKNNNIQLICILEKNITNSALSGLFRTIQTEIPALNPLCIYVNNLILNSDALKYVIDNSLKYNEVYINGSKIYNKIITDDLDNHIAICNESRMNTDDAPLSSNEAPLSSNEAPLSSHEALYPSAYRSINAIAQNKNIKLIKNTIINQPNKIHVSVEYFDINYRDTMILNESLPVDALHNNYFENDIGGCFIGYTDNNGARVFGVARNSCSTDIFVSSKYVFSLEGISIENALSLLNYLTAYYALIVIADIKKNENVLVHSGAGGIGIAAINICKKIGANVFTTVGNKLKEDFINITLGIPSSNIKSSHNDGFVSFPKMDVILNSLSGELMLSSFNCLNFGGRFIEIGKKDVYNNCKLKLNDSIGMYSVVAIDKLLNDSSFVETVLPNCVNFMRTIDYNMPYRLFAFNQLKSAINSLYEGENIGKIIVKTNKIYTVNNINTNGGIHTNDSLYVWPKGTYIILGGTRGFGLEFAKWILSKGISTDIVLISTSGKCNLVQRSNFVHPNIKVIKCDCINKEQLKSILDKYKQIACIVNSCLNLNDNNIINQTEDTFNTSFCVKVDITKNILDIAKNKTDLIIMFSSIAYILGSSGQSNYNAGNAYCDAISAQLSQEGIRSLSINWGPIGNVGYVSNNLSVFKNIWEPMGFKLLQPEVAFNQLDKCIKLGISNVIIADVDWDKFVSSREDTHGIKRYSMLVNTHKKVGVISTQTENNILDKVKNTILTSLGMTTIDTSKPLSNFGVDSMIANSIENKLNAVFGTKFSITDVLTMSVENIANTIIK